MGESITSNEKAKNTFEMISRCSMYVDCEDCPFEGLCVNFVAVTGLNPMEFKEAANKNGL